MRVSVARLRQQLWDASRQLGRLQVAQPKHPELRRAVKDVNAALHGSYEVWREFEGVLDALPQEVRATLPWEQAKDSLGSGRTGEHGLER